MKKSLIPSLLLLSALSANAQVDNYSLRLAQGATVKCGLMTEMNSLSEYTVQIWLNPTKWTKGATLLSVGDNIEIKLDAEGTIKAKLGSAEATITNADLKAGSWNQLTIVVKDGQCTALVNGKNAYEAKGNYAMPADCSELTLGGNFEGRLDEVRLWSTALGSERNYYINNTLNKWAPEASNLLVY